MTKRIFLWVLVPIAAVVLIMWEAPVAFGKKLVLFSEVDGVLVDGTGSPQGGVRIERQWTWRGTADSDETTTDGNGRFRFPEVTERSLMAAILPQEPVVGQDMIAHGANGPLKIWGAMKNSYERNSELDGRPLRLSCRIDKEPDDTGLYWGTCVERGADD